MHVGLKITFLAFYTLTLICISFCPWFTERAMRFQVGSRVHVTCWARQAILSSSKNSVFYSNIFDDQVRFGYKLWVVLLKVRQDCYIKRMSTLWNNIAFKLGIIVSVILVSFTGDNKSDPVHTYPEHLIFVKVAHSVIYSKFSTS